MEPSPKTIPTAVAQPVSGRRRVFWGRALLALVALLPVGLLSMYAVKVVRRSVRELVRANNQSAGMITAELMSRELEQCIGLAVTISSLPTFDEAVQRHEEAAVRVRLERVVKAYPRIDRAFVTDPAGVLWSDYPRAPESIGRNFSQRDWYRGLSRGWQPYVSEVYRRNAEPRLPVVAVSVPIRGNQGELMGALVCQYRLDEISDWLRRIPVGDKGYVFVVDHTGTVAAHPRLNLQDRVCEEYRSVAAMRRALLGGFQTTEYRDPVDGIPMVATFLPTRVAGQRWVVVAQQPLADAQAPVYWLEIQIGLAGAILALVAMAAVVWLSRVDDRIRRLNVELAERNRRLQETAAELERSNAELEQFASVASHDLQEPLRMVASFTRLLAERYRGKLGADADEFISYAVDGAVRMQALINDLLSYSRVGRRGTPRVSTDCQQALEIALDNLRAAREESGAVVTHDPLPTVTADARQLSQLFQNLIGNGIKFHRDLPPRIHVSARPENGVWVFAVRDNGIGIDPKDLGRLFQIFQRLHRREEYPGTGIGLAICKKIVEHHGGRIWVESEPGCGSTFRFTLPFED